MARPQRPVQQRAPQQPVHVAEPGSVEVLPAADEVEEDAEEEGAEDKPTCFVTDHAGITAKARNDLVQRRLEIFGGVFSVVNVCRPHAAMMEAARQEIEDKKKSKQVAPHGICHLCGRPVGVLPVTDAGDHSTYRFHMDDPDQKCCETCPCEAVNPENGEPVGKKRATIWLKTLEK